MTQIDTDNSGLRTITLLVTTQTSTGDISKYHVTRPVPSRMRNIGNIIISIGHALRTESIDRGDTAIVTRVDDWTGHVSNEQYRMTDDQADECARLGLYGLVDWLRDGRGRDRYYQLTGRSA